MPPHCPLTCSPTLFQASISTKSLPEPTAARGEFPSPFPTYPTQPLVITRELTQLVSAFVAYQLVHASSSAFAFLPWSWGTELKTQLV